MANNPYRGWKVRGFWNGDKTELVLVKGSKSRIIKVIYASSGGGKWTFATTDGVKITLPKEKKEIFYLKKAEIITNCVRAYDETVYDIVRCDFTKLDVETTEYNVAYYKRCFIRKRLHISSPIKKIWKENGRYHAITMSGAHYAFRIK